MGGAKGKKGARGATRAARVLEELAVSFELLEYEVPPDADGRSLGEAVAAALGVPPETMFKTLIAEGADGLLCAVVPVSGSLSLKALAAAAGTKKVAMADPAAAERTTGYVTGGISPLGQLKGLPTFIDGSCTALVEVHVSAGKRGLQLRLRSGDLVAATGAKVVEGLSV